MADEWFTSADVRNAVGATQAVSETRMEMAAKVARGKTRDECGPVFPVETVTERVRVRVPAAEVPLKYRPAALTSVTLYRSGTVLTTADFDFDGQVLFRKDGDRIAEDVTVVYTSGFATAADIPGEVFAMAELIAAQYIRVARRFILQGQDPTQVSFAIPAAAREIASEYLLAPQGV